MTWTFMKFMDLCSRIQIKKRKKKCEFWFSNTFFFSNPMQCLLRNAKILLCPLEWHGNESPPPTPILTHPLPQSPSELSTSSAPKWSNLQCARPFWASTEWFQVKEPPWEDWSLDVLHRLSKVKREGVPEFTSRLCETWQFPKNGDAAGLPRERGA